MSSNIPNDSSDRAIAGDVTSRAPLSKITASRRRLHIACSLVGLLGFAVASAVSCAPAQKAARAPQIVQLNQGWSAQEIEFYDHATEGTNLAPLEFLLNLPDPARPGSLFVEKITTEYGFIPSEKSRLNPHGLPVGFAIDERPHADYQDRVYVGITCAACHTRQMTYSKADAGGSEMSWVLPVHGGPALVNIPRFKKDLYDAFFALLKDDNMAREFGKRVLNQDPDAAALAALRDEIREFTGPVSVTQAVIQQSKVPTADFGPGNLNALTQGNYNNVGLGGWLTKKGYLSPGGDPPILPRFEGTANFPPVWFAPSDDWAQWFVEIHNAGPRNWVQSVSTSEVRPPRMVEALKAGVVVGSIHFDNIAQIQRSLELLRTPKWVEEVFGPVDHAAVEQGRVLYEQQCARCHTRTVLPPNEFGIVFKQRPAFDVGTDPTAYEQFVEGGPKRVAGLQGLADNLLILRKAQLVKSVGPDVAGYYMNLYSRGRPNKFALATDQYGEGATWSKSGAAYWASPLEGIFASSPYFHNGSVRTLWDVLTAPDQREKSFHTGTMEFDAEGIGLRSEGPFVYDTQEPGKGNGGHPFGTDLPKEQKAALIEYLKSI